MCFITQFKIRNKDIYTGHWREAVNASTTLTLYKDIKQTFEMYEYLKILRNRKFRNILARLRLSSLFLAIEQGRHINQIRSERKCVLCNKNKIEDEFYFVYICEKCKDLRTLYIQAYYRNRPNMLNFIDVLQFSSHKILFKLSVFITKSYESKGQPL